MDSDREHAPASHWTGNSIAMVFGTEIRQVRYLQQPHARVVDPL
jgi:hypothetical protein